MFQSGLSSQSAEGSFDSLADVEAEDGAFSDKVDCEGFADALSACRVLFENRDWRIGLLVDLIRYCHPT